MSGSAQMPPSTIRLLMAGLALDFASPASNMCTRGMPPAVRATAPGLSAQESRYRTLSLEKWQTLS